MIRWASPKMRWSFFRSCSALPYFSRDPPGSTRCHSWVPPVHSPPPVLISSHLHRPGRTWSHLALSSWCGKNAASAVEKVFEHLIGGKKICWISIILSLLFFILIISHRYFCVLHWGERESWRLCETWVRWWGAGWRMGCRYHETELCLYLCVNICCLFNQKTAIAPSCKRKWLCAWLEGSTHFFANSSNSYFFDEII